LLIVLGVIIPFIWLLAYGFGRNPRYISSPLIEKEAPDFVAPRFDGGTVRLGDLRGKVVFINFWASWCIPCREEARTLEEAWQRYKEREVVFLGINIQDKEQDARRFLKEFGITYPNVRDATGKVAVDYGVWGIPESFFVNGDGRIAYKHVGALNAPTLATKLKETIEGVVSAEEGRGNFSTIR